jgi:hypothetical protein
MESRSQRRPFWRCAAALVALTVVVPEWPARADPRCGPKPCGRTAFTAFNFSYFPQRQKTVSYRDTLDFVNADPMSRAAGGHTVTHLNEHGPPRFDTGPVRFGYVVKVAGLEALTPQKYLFYCRIHPWMKGKFHVVGGNIDVLPIAP